MYKIAALALLAVAVTARPAAEMIGAVMNTTDCPSCTPKIDVRASVIEAYKKHRAHVAIIGDWGDCSHTVEGYTWDVNWGDDDEYKKQQDLVGPYQATHVYKKKGPQTVTVNLCQHTEGCTDHCSTYSKKINVKP